MSSFFPALHPYAQIHPHNLFSFNILIWNHLKATNSFCYSTMQDTWKTMSILSLARQDLAWFFLFFFFPTLKTWKLFPSWRKKYGRTHNTIAIGERLGYLPRNELYWYTKVGWVWFCNTVGPTDRFFSNSLSKLIHIQTIFSVDSKSVNRSV